MPRCEYLNRYPADVICLFEFSPLFDPGASFCWRVCLAQIHHLPASVLSRGFHFPGAGSASGRGGIEPEPARLLHNPKGPCLEPAAMARARPGARHTGQVRRAACPFRSFGMLSGSNSLEALGRCNVTPSPDAAERPIGSCITQIIGVR